MKKKHVKKILKELALLRKSLLRKSISVYVSGSNNVINIDSIYHAISHAAMRTDCACGCNHLILEQLQRCMDLFFL